MQSRLFLILFTLLTLLPNAWADVKKALSYAVIGDAGQWNSNTQLVRDSILRQKVKRLILPGDNLYSEKSGTYGIAWEPWSSKDLELDIVALGNHTAGYKEEIEYFKMPAEYYSKTVGDAVRFLVLNSDNEKNVKEQHQWLEEQLKAATERFVFLVFHHPTFTVSTDHGWKEKKQFQLGIQKLVKTYRSKITALIVGHDHLAEMIYFDDLPVILSGATHHLRSDSPVDNIQEGVRVKTAWMFAGGSHWARLDIPSTSTKAKVSFIRASDDEVVYEAEIKTGL